MARKTTNKKIPPLVNKEELLSKKERHILGVGTYKDDYPYVSLKYIQTRSQCFSEWNKKELESFSAFLNKLKESSWNQIEKTGGKKGKKVGFGMTKHKSSKISLSKEDLPEFSDDLKFFELRCGQQARLHGFRCKSAFFLVRLDKNHDQL